MGRHDDTDYGRSDDRHDPSIDRDDFASIPDAQPSEEQHAEARRLWDQHDPSEWDGMVDDEDRDT